MDLLSISKCSAEAFNRSKYWRQSECLDVNELNNNLEHNQNIPEIHTLFPFHLPKKNWVQKWTCDQSLNVQQEPLTDRNTAENHARMFGFI